MTHAPGSLPRSRVLAFGGIGIPLAAIGLPFAVYLPRFYAGDMGVGLELTGTIFMLLRFWDIATDPLMGYLVDRWPSRWGRVKHWLALSVPTIGISAFFLYMPGDPPVSPLYLIGWLLVFYVGLTMLQTPHQAWAPALARTYDERSRLFQWREIMLIAALLLTLALPDVLAGTIGLDRGGQIMVMGLVLIVSLPLTVGAALWFIPDARPEAGAPQADFSPKAVREALHNGALWRVLLIEVCVGVAIAGTAATYLFAAEWGFGVVEGAGSVLMLFFIAGFCAIPFWMWLSRKTEKHLTLRILTLLAGITFLGYLPLSMFGGYELLILGSVLAGVTFGTPNILVRSMMADLVERELVRSGEDRSGLYYSLMTSAYKTGASFAVGIPFILLGQVVGFDPVGDNSPEVVQGLMLVFVGVPTIAFLTAAALTWGYPLNRAAQSQFGATLRERAGDTDA